MSKASAKPSTLILAILFFLQWGAPGMWSVSFSNVLRSYGLEGFLPYAFACGALAAFISPLFVGAMADRDMSPSRLLRWLNWLSAFFLTMTFVSVHAGWGGFTMLGFMLCHALCSSPVFSLATSIVFSSLENPSKGFGPLRVWGTIGWAAAGWVVSWVLHADATPLAGYASAAVLTGIGFFTYLLPDITPPKQEGRLSWKQRMGLDALQLLSHRDHRIVFLTTLLFTIPLAAFYPLTPLHLRDLGVSAPAATMALGQLTEVLCLLLLGSIWKFFRLKWIFLTGISFGILRYAFFSLDSQPWLIAGITLHGMTYALYFITVQIYLAERISREWRTRAQALLTLLTSGVGNLLGYLSTGLWREACVSEGHTVWPLFWWVLCAATCAVAILFIVTYHGVGRRPAAEHST